MKPVKLDKKLNLRKLTVSHLTEVRGGVDRTNTGETICIEVPTCDTCETWCIEVRTCATCYQYTCPGWTICPNLPC